MRGSLGGCDVTVSLRDGWVAGCGMVAECRQAELRDVQTRGGGVWNAWACEYMGSMPVYE